MRLTIVYRSTKPNGQLTIKMRHYKKGVTDGEIILHYKTKLFCFKKEFPNNIELDKRHKLENCMAYVNEKFYSKGDNFIPTKAWFHKRCNEFFNKKDSQMPFLVNWIEAYIKQAKLEDKSERRIKNLKQLITIVNKYDDHLEMEELTIDELDKFKFWLREDQRYGINTANNIIADLKTICSKAFLKVKFPRDFVEWKKYKQSKASAFNNTKIITLSLEEINKIEALNLKKEHLINARKWLIIGVNTAQRGGELLSLTKDDFVYDSKGNLMIDFEQKKVGKVMRIPALKKVKEIFEKNELPHKISLQKLNNHLKTLAEIAEIDTPIRWYKREVVEIDGKQRQRHILRERPKYEYIASHIFRRTFCTYYMEIGMDESEIRKISGHESKEMLMTYVREARPDFKNWEAFM
ncbi:MAG: tyrosine-type recombinase/integrase [Flavobacteriaceae bacterium]